MDDVLDEIIVALPTLLEHEGDIALAPPDGLAVYTPMVTLGDLGRELAPIVGLSADDGNIFGDALAERMLGEIAMRRLVSVGNGREALVLEAIVHTSTYASLALDENGVIHPLGLAQWMVDMVAMPNSHMQRRCCKFALAKHRRDLIALNARRSARVKQSWKLKRRARSDAPVHDPLADRSVVTEITTATRHVRTVLVDRAAVCFTDSD